MHGLATRAPRGLVPRYCAMGGLAPLRPRDTPCRHSAIRCVVPARRICFAIATGLLLAGCDRDEPEPAATRAPAANASAAAPSPAPRASGAPAPVSSGAWQPAAGDLSEAPDGYVPVLVTAVAPTSEGNAVLLVHPSSQKGVPVFVGGTEALSISLRLDDQRYPRPLTHDLFDSVLKQLGARVAAVRVDELRDNVYHGSVVVVQGGQMQRFDSRVSDAIALALGHRAPVFVARSVLDRAGIPLDAKQLDAGSEAKPDAGRGPGIAL